MCINTTFSMLWVSTYELRATSFVFLWTLFTVPTQATTSLKLVKKNKPTKKHFSFSYKHRI